MRKPVRKVETVPSANERLPATLACGFTNGVEVLRSDAIRTLATLIPADRILTETDNPGGWRWMTQELGFPELLLKVEDMLADVRDTDQRELSAQIDNNFRELLKRGGAAFATP